MKTRFFTTLFMMVLAVAAMAKKVPQSSGPKPAEADRLMMPTDTVFSVPAGFVPDTLVDLNRQLGGIKELSIPKGTVIPEAIEITPAGQIILLDDARLVAESYKFELKVTASDKEAYIVQVKISKNGDKLVVNTVSDKIEMATGFRSEGKIYVVVAVSLVLFVVLISYLVVLDRRMRRLQVKLQNRSVQ